MLDIEKLQKDFKEYEEKQKRRDKIYSVIEREGKEGRDYEVGKYQNGYRNEIQIALQYSEGGTNYWKDEELNKAFNKAVSRNFRKLLEEALEEIDKEFKEAESKFNKYVLKGD